jgi:hypothetical protein
MGYSKDHNKRAVMKRSNIFGTALITGLIILCATASYAMPIWGTAVTESDLSGLRTSDRESDQYGIYAAGLWADGGFTISWNIALTSEFWTYTYTLTGIKKKISHFILEVTKDEFDINILEGSSPVDDQYSEDGLAKTWASSNGITFNDLYNIKFGLRDDKTVTYTLVTDRSPVWGVFIAESKKEGIYARSTALSQEDYKNDTGLTKYDFIARPNGGAAVPAPPTMLLVGAGLIGLAGLGRKNIFKKQ